ncbi:MAG: hypothetical protein HY291_05165 [Planctomycetes bacterium]|nr:hypothetical protein [Planctomycetota bacterium]
MRIRTIVFFTAAVLTVALRAQGAEAPAKPTEAQVLTWIQLLSSDDFEVREKAEKDLKAAGASAIPLITKAMEAGDAELRARGQRVLDDLAWAVRPAVASIPNALPAETIFVVHTTDLKAAVARLRTETAAGKLYDSAALESVKATVGDAVATGSQMGDEEKKTALTWLERYGGPSGISFISSDRTKEWQERDNAVAIVGLNDPDPAKAWSEFMTRFPLGGGQTANERYHGIDVAHASNGFWHEGRARVLNLGVNSMNTNYNSVKLVIDRLADDKAPRLNQAPQYKEAAGKLDPAPLAELYWNVAELIKQAAPENDGKAKTALDELGFSAVKFLAVSLSTKNGLCAERAFAKVEGERKGVVKLLGFAKSTAKLAPLAPPDALAFVTIPADGRMVYDTILGLSEKLSPGDAAQFKAAVTQMDVGLGFKVVDTLIAPLKGEAAVWATKPSGVAPIPELGAAFETPDAASAKTLAENLSKLILTASGKPDMGGKADFKGRTCFWIKKELNGADFPYTISWCADGARVLFSGSQEGLQALVNRIDNKAAGLESAEDFKALLASIPEAERGGMIYVNTAEVAGWGLPILLPILTAQAPPEMKEKLNAALKDPKALIRGFPGTLLSISGAADGVQARANGGLPATADVLAVPVLSFRIMMMRMEAEIQKAAAQPQPVIEEDKTADAPKPEKKEEVKK